MLEELIFEYWVYRIVDHNSRAGRIALDRIRTVTAAQEPALAGVSDRCLTDAALNFSSSRRVTFPAYLRRKMREYGELTT